MLRTIYTFQNSAIAIEPIHEPDGTVSGRCIVLMDNDSGDVYRYPMPDDAAKQVGQQLMGIGGLAVANGAGMEREIRRAGGKKG